MKEAKAWAIAVDQQPQNVAEAHRKLDLVADCKFDFSDPNLDDFLESVGASMSRPDPSTVPIDLVWEEMNVPDGASGDCDIEKRHWTHQLQRRLRRVSLEAVGGRTG